MTWGPLVCSRLPYLHLTSIYSAGDLAGLGMHGLGALPCLSETHSAAVSFCGHSLLHLQYLTQEVDHTLLYEPGKLESVSEMHTQGTVLYV